MYIMTHVMFLYTQETGRLFHDIYSLARQSLPNEKKRELTDQLLECELVELTKNMWSRYLRPEQLELQTKKLPEHLFSSLKVNRVSYFCIM